MVRGAKASRATKDSNSKDMALSSTTLSLGTVVVKVDSDGPDKGASCCREERTGMKFRCDEVSKGVLDEAFSHTDEGKKTRNSSRRRVG